MELKYSKRFKGRTGLVLKCTKKEQINIAELDLLDVGTEHKIPEGLLRVVDKKLDRYRISYDVSCCFRLKDYYSRSALSEDEVLGLVAQTIETFMEMEAQRFTLQKLVMDVDYVFYSYKKQRMQFVFCPVQNNFTPKEDSDKLRFIRDIATGAVIRPSENGEDKMFEFLSWLSELKTFSVSEIAKYLGVTPVRRTQGSIGVPMTTGGSRLSPKSQSGVGTPEAVSGRSSFKPAAADAAPAPVHAAVNAASVPSCGAHSIAMPSDTSDAGTVSAAELVEQNNYSYVPPGQTEPRRPASSESSIKPLKTPAASPAPPAPPVPSAAPVLPVPPVGTKPQVPFGQFPAGSLRIPGDTVDPPVSSGIAAPGDTIEDDSPVIVRTGVLYHPLTAEEFTINGMLTTIGREGVDGYGRPVRPDVIVTTDRGVSKIHAYILQENGYFYIADAAGKSNTFVNDRAIPSGVSADGTLNGQWTPLSDGTTIRLAQQGFVFHIR